VLEVKGMISHLIEFPERQQRLIFAGCELRDTRTLSFYDVVADSLLLVIRRGFLKGVRESVQKVYNGMEALQNHIVGLPLHVENLALQQRIFQSVTELHNTIEQIEKYEETLDEAPYGPWADHRMHHVWAE